ncbi:dehydrogenase, putative [Labilithrix luteola]|uniref:Dehydrogenase, putative n=1 Tax=Labilithrix luteola TaxID=1391654 RepID=A0A0K1PPT7_9BACT|nr:dehydrogenase, putative [Labilithrix luteola]
MSLLGLGAMGHALAAALIDAGHPTTIWNRTPGKADALVARGAKLASTVRDAVSVSPLVVTCLLDHGSVQETLGPVADVMAHRSLVNLTTTTPNQAREFASWADDHDVAYLDGGIMAVPAMIGGPGSAILYSGSSTVFGDHKPVLDLWGESTYFGPDAGMASLYDLAMLASMYVMFGGFMQGAAMVGAAGVTATEFASRTTPFLAAMTAGFSGFAAIIDAKNYTGEGQQSLEFSDLGKIVQTSIDQGVSPDIIAPVQALIRRQIAAGHGKEGFSRIFEELRAGKKGTEVMA